MKHWIYIIGLLLFVRCKDENHLRINANKEHKGLANEVLSNSNALEAKEYVQYVEDPGNGLQVIKEIENMKFSLQYKPYEYVVLCEKRKDSLKKTELKEEIKEMDAMQYFTFKIQAKNYNQELLKYNLSEEEEYYSRVEYFSFKMQEDIKLIEGLDTLDCGLFHFERTFGVAPYATFVLGFEEKKSNKDKTFLYEDRVFGSGSIKLNIKQENINNVPTLKTY